MTHYKIGFEIGEPDNFLIGFNKFMGEDEEGAFKCWGFGLLLFSVSLYKYINQTSL